MEDEEHIDIKGIAEKARTKNGNTGISQSDVLWYLVHRVDKINKTLGQTRLVKDCVDYRRQEKDRNSQKITWIIAITAIVISASAFAIKAFF